MSEDDGGWLKDLAKVVPGEKLLETLRAFFGTAYEPTHKKRLGKAEAENIVRKAKAEGEALLIKTESEAKSQDLAQRAYARLTQQELRRQKNLESIIQKTIDELPPKVDTVPVDQDWLHFMLNNAQDVSDEQMQSLWSKVLAGEVSKPGSYSLRTLNLMRMLKKSDARLFTKFCAFISVDEDGRHVFFTTHNAYGYARERGVGTPQRHHLQSIGLVGPEVMWKLSNVRNDCIELEYFGHKYKVTSAVRLTGPSNSPFVNYLTEMGEELFPICGAKPDIGYYKTLFDVSGLPIFIFETNEQMEKQRREKEG